VQLKDTSELPLSPRWRNLLKRLYPYSTIYEEFNNLNLDIKIEKSEPITSKELVEKYEERMPR
jgi:hypothetical protein